MAEIVICEFMDTESVDWLRERADVLYDPDLVFDEPRLHAELKGARGLIVRSSARVDGRLLDAGPDLQVIGRLGVGLERFDLPVCAERGVAVLKADGANALSVAEYTMTMAAMLLRIGAYTATASMVDGEWPRQQFIGRELEGKTLGIIGLGAIGGIVAPRAKAIGMRVVGCDPYLDADNPVWESAERSSLETVLAQSDILTLHTPLTDETRGIVGAKTLPMMKPGAMLINAARGGVADERAVADALRSGHLGGAAIDVFENEPLTAEAGAAFAGLSNVILTPHVAGVTTESNARVSQMTVESVLTALRNG